MVVEHFPSNGRLWFSVSSPGCLCVEGPLDARSRTTADGATRWIEVRLRRGWSVLCCARESETNFRLAGAAIEVDGTVVGSTDGNGVYPLTLPERPRSLELRHGDRLGLPDPPFDLATAESCRIAVFAFARG